MDFDGGGAGGPEDGPGVIEQNPTLGLWSVVIKSEWQENSSRPSMIGSVSLSRVRCPMSRTWGLASVPFSPMRRNML